MCEAVPVFGDYRRFSENAEKIARLWREQIVSDADWRLHGAPGRTESGAYFVASQTARGFAKPWLANPSVEIRPRAALEKIASDLAFDLGLPVPPCVLWRRPDCGGEQEACVSISSEPFTRPNTWFLAKQAGRDTLARWEREIAPAASAMIVFDTWLVNGDRLNGGNLLVTEENSGTAPLLRWAYIDFANAFGWAVNGWQAARLVDIYPPDVLEDPVAMRTTIERIEGYPRERISEIVDRIPVEFLPRGHRDRIREGLLDRKGRIRRIVARAHEGIA